ncbi:MAG: hypothetical protein DHS20C17_33420 [Cyclobacteriaceae bacterium]|nr:MAG: hypothetical protein DHS20C17_33420 [Cyclobacteriaceae bacterium]
MRTTTPNSSVTQNSSSPSKQTIDTQVSNFNPAYAHSLVKNLIIPINDRYFKCKLIGFEPLPQRNKNGRPLIYISNHSGMAFPWDGVVFSSILFKNCNYQLKNAVRPLAAPALTQSNLMNAFMIKDFWKICGAVEARYQQFETLMNQQDSNVFVYPEGVDGIGKGFNHKYQLQRFATSFVRMAIKYQTEVIPFATVNGEYINPYVLSWPWLNKWSKKIGIPYIPIGFHTLLLLVFPWLFYYGLPAKLTYVRGETIRPYKMVDKPFEELTDFDIRAVRDKIKNKVQKELNMAVEKYGKQRFSKGKFKGSTFKELLKLWYYTPLGWPLLFHEHHRLFMKNHGKPFNMKVSFWSGFKYLFRNPFTLSFYLPVIGWIPLLIRGYWKHNIK